jgi:hypothetical protein
MPVTQIKKGQDKGRQAIDDNHAAQDEIRHNFIVQGTDGNDKR